MFQAFDVLCHVININQMERNSFDQHSYLDFIIICVNLSMFMMQALL